MKRAIIVPASLSGAPLNELKAWLGIRLSDEDGPLLGLLQAALETCEAFIRRMPLEAVCEEVLPAGGSWYWLATEPVQAISSLDAVGLDGSRSTIASGDYQIDLEADGRGRIRHLRPATQTRLAVRFTAGIAPDWASLPEGLKHGILRLAAHHYRQRDHDPDKASPPAAVVALWQPWRRMQLA